MRLIRGSWLPPVWTAANAWPTCFIYTQWVVLLEVALEAADWGLGGVDLTSTVAYVKAVRHGALVRCPCLRQHELLVCIFYLLVFARVTLPPRQTGDFKRDCLSRGNKEWQGTHPSKIQILK